MSPARPPDRRFDTLPARHVVYWTWYLLIALLAWAFKLPWIALAALVVAAGWRVVPDPVERFRTRRRVRELRERIEGYPGDLLARRDLARIYLERRRPERAAALLEEAIAKGLHDPEAFYLLGQARLRAGDAAGALDPIVKSVSTNERLLLGEPYFTAAEALERAARLAEAEDALERGLAMNSSRVDAHVRLGRVRAGRGDTEGARNAYRAAMETWKQLPGYLQRQTFGSYLRARWALLRTK